MPDLFCYPAVIRVIRGSAVGVLIACLLACVAGEATAQAKKPPAKAPSKAPATAPAAPPPAAVITTPATSTTLDSVYSPEQAGRGKEAYSMYCRSCHIPASHTGPVFKQWWAGRRVSELFEYVSTRMPKNEPASLAPEDYADVVAYLLKMNAMPAGKSELEADPTALKQIRIVTPTKRAKP
jgi:mono/diheme cytochrome c family protein